MASIIHSDKLPEHTSHDQALWLYNALDCAVTREVFSVIQRELDTTTEATYRFTRNMMAPALKMMLRGWRIDNNVRENITSMFSADRDRLESNLNKLTTAICGSEINPRSPNQLKKFLYEVLKLPEVKSYNKYAREWTVTVNREALEKLETYFYARPIINHILEIRDLEKKISVLSSRVDEDGRMRCSYNVVGTIFGRWTSSKNVFGRGTNLNNITDEMREIFVPDHGKKLGNVDLEQAESRVVGYIAEDENYIAACEGADLHTTIAGQLWPDITSRDKAEQKFYRHLSFRDIAKRGGHLSNYKGTSAEMARRLKLPAKLCEDFQSKYYASFPGITRWHHRVQRMLADSRPPGYTTLLGRRLLFFGHPYDTETLKSAISSEPQSVVGDLLNIGLFKLWTELEPEVEILGQVYDSITFQYSEKDDSVLSKIQAIMRHPIRVGNRTMIIPTEASCGWNWRKRKEPTTGEVINPYGLAKWTPEKPDKRAPPAEFSILDRRVC